MVLYFSALDRVAETITRPGPESAVQNGKLELVVSTRTHFASTLIASDIELPTNHAHEFLDSLGHFQFSIRLSKYYESVPLTISNTKQFQHLYINHWCETSRLEKMRAMARWSISGFSHYLVTFPFAGVLFNWN